MIKKHLRQIIIIISFILYSSNILACSCEYAWNDSFSLTAKNSELVALVKVISFDEYLDREILGFDGKMPYSMTVEIIKQYKGTNHKKTIKIFGDNGILCRPYLSEFKINEYYLIAPNALESELNNEYDFFSCRTEYLKVDINTNMAYGKYSLTQNELDITTYENVQDGGSQNLWILVLLVIPIVLGIGVWLRKKKRNANNAYN